MFQKMQKEGKKKNRKNANNQKELMWLYHQVNFKTFIIKNKKVI